MDLYGFFTDKGQDLAVKLAAGTTPLTITRVLSGSGETLPTAVALAQPVQVLSVNSPTRKNNTAILPVTLMAAEATDSYSLTELGVYAMDPDVGEILYKVYRADKAIAISAGSSLVLRFYLEETIVDDGAVSVICSPAGIVTEETLQPILQKLDAGYPQTVSVFLDASELPAFFEKLPRFLNVSYNITVSGTLNTALSIPCFFGSGGLAIKAETLGNCTLSKVSVSSCDIPVTFQSIQFQETANFGNYACILEAHDSHVTASGCSFTGTGSASTACAFGASQHGALRVSSCSVAGCNVIAYAGNMGTVLVNGSCNFQSNTTGAMVYGGGTVMIGTGSISDTLDAPFNDKRGGCVIAYNGSLV